MCVPSTVAYRVWGSATRPVLRSLGRGRGPRLTGRSHEAPCFLQLYAFEAWVAAAGGGDIQRITRRPRGRARLAAAEVSPGDSYAATIGRACGRARLAAAEVSPGDSYAATVGRDEP